MQVQIAKWGNSLALRIPSKLASALGVKEGSLTDMSLRGDALVVRRKTGSYKLDDLLEQIRPENLHGELKTGRAVDAEVIN